MKLFSKISEIEKTDVNDLIDNAKHPERVVSQVVIDLEEQVRIATRALNQLKTNEPPAKKQLDEAIARSNNAEEEAKQALLNGDKLLATKKLEKKIAIDINVSAYQIIYDTIHSQVCKLNDRVEMLQSKLDDAKKEAEALDLDIQKEKEKKLQKEQELFEAKEKQDLEAEAALNLEINRMILDMSDTDSMNNMF